MKHFLYFTLLLAFSQVFTKTYIRYNQLGYHYNQQLKFVIISDESLTGKNWFITNSSNESIESKQKVNLVNQLILQRNITT